MAPKFPPSASKRMSQRARKMSTFTWQGMGDKPEVSDDEEAEEVFNRVAASKQEAREDAPMPSSSDDDEQVEKAYGMSPLLRGHPGRRKTGTGLSYGADNIGGPAKKHFWEVLQDDDDDSDEEQFVDELAQIRAEQERRQFEELQAAREGSRSVTVMEGVYDYLDRPDLRHRQQPYTTQKSKGLVSVNHGPSNGIRLRGKLESLHNHPQAQAQRAQGGGAAVGGSAARARQASARKKVVRGRGQLPTHVTAMSPNLVDDGWADDEAGYSYATKVEYEPMAAYAGTARYGTVKTAKPKVAHGVPVHLPPRARTQPVLSGRNRSPQHAGEPREGMQGSPEKAPYPAPPDARVEPSVSSTTPVPEKAKEMMETLVDPYMDQQLPPVRVWRTPQSKRPPPPRSSAVSWQINNSQGGLSQPDLRAAQTLQNPLVRGQVDNDKEAQVMIATWLAGFDSAHDGYSSEALYAEAKLHEALRLTEHLATPNRVRTAMMCYLATMITANMGYFRPIMSSVLRELVSSIYYDPERVVVPNSKEPPRAEAIYEARPFFTAFTKLQHEYAILEKQCHALGVHKKVTRLMGEARGREISHWQACLKAAMFQRWRTQRFHHAHYVAATTAYVNRMLAKSFTPQEAFRAWKAAAIASRLETAKDRATQLEKQFVELQTRYREKCDRVEELEAKNEYLEKDNGALTDRLEEMTEKFADKSEMDSALLALKTANEQAAMASQIAIALGETTLNVLKTEIHTMWELMPGVQRLLELGFLEGQDEELCGDWKEACAFKEKTAWALGPEVLELAEERVEDLEMDAVLLRWANVRLNRVHEEASPIDNFTTCWSDGAALAEIVYYLCPRGINTGIKVLDQGAKLECVFDAVKKVHPRPEEFISAKTLLAEEEDLTAAYLARLFLCPSGPTCPAPLENLPSGMAEVMLHKLQGELSEADQNWVEIESLLRTCTKGARPGEQNSLPKDFTDQKRSIRKKINQMKRVCGMVEEGVEWLRDGHTRWMRLKDRATEYAWQVLFSRIRHEALPVLNERAAGLAEAFTTMNMGKMRDLFKIEGLDGEELDAEVTAIDAVLQEHCTAMQRIFQYYSMSASSASSAGTNTGGYNSLQGANFFLSGQEFRTLMKDINIVDPQLSMATVDLIFMKSCMSDDSLPAGAVSSKPKDSGNQMDPGDFVEALCRLANVKYKSLELTLSERVRMVLESHYLPYASQIDTRPFRSSVREELVQNVFRANRGNFEKIFTYYCANQGGGGQKDSISMGEFKKLVQDCQINEGPLTEMAIGFVYSCCQDNPSQASELTYSDFLEAVAALAVHKHCNPYQPFYQRVENFINRTLIPNAKSGKRMPAKSRETSVDKKARRETKLKLKSTAE